MSADPKEATATDAPKAAAEQEAPKAAASEAAKPASEEVKTIYVGSLPWNVTEDALKDAFAKFGDIASVRIPKDKQDRSRGYGFVEYKSADSCQKAVEGMNETEMDGRKIKVSISQPRPKDERRGGDRRGEDRRGEDRYERRGGDRYDRRGGDRRERDY